MAHSIFSKLKMLGFDCDDQTNFAIRLNFECLIDLPPPANLNPICTFIFLGTAAEATLAENAQKKDCFRERLWSKKKRT